MSFESTSMLRTGLAVFAGLGVGAVVNMVLITLNTTVLYPTPKGVSYDDPESFKAYIASLPPLAYVVVFCAHFGQAIVGGLVAYQIEGGSPTACYIVGGLTMMGSILNNISLSVPLWTWLEVPVFPFLSYYTAQFAASISKTSTARKD